MMKLSASTSAISVNVSSEALTPMLTRPSFTRPLKVLGAFFTVSASFPRLTLSNSPSNTPLAMPIAIASSSEAPLAFASRKPLVPAFVASSTAPPGTSEAARESSPDMPV